MAKITTIEWCDSTLNLSMGCDGCELWNRKAGIRHCYAGQLTDRYGGKNGGFPAVFEEPILFLDRLEAALKWPDLTGTARPEKPWLDGKPRLIFLGDMGDTWTESLHTEEWILPALERMADSPHQFLMLTKRPGRMAEYSQRHPLPKNVWPMTTVTSQKTIRRITDLDNVCGGGPKGVSCEPLLGPVQLFESLQELLACQRCGGEYASGEANRGRSPCCMASGDPIGQVGGPEIDWVIAGGESGPRARPMHPDWVRSLRDQCADAEVPFFFKQWGEYLPLEDCPTSFPSSFFLTRDGRRLIPLDGVVEMVSEPMCRVGKKVTGRLLDGQEWNQIPEVVA